MLCWMDIARVFVEHMQTDFNPVTRSRRETLSGKVVDVMVSGNVAASLFVGPDAVHATGALQPLVLLGCNDSHGGHKSHPQTFASRMTVLGQGQDGRPFYQPATLKAFEEALWRRRGQAAEGEETSSRQAMSYGRNPKQKRIGRS